MPGTSHGQRSLAGYSLWAIGYSHGVTKESDTGFPNTVAVPCHNNSSLGLLTCHAERSTSLDTVTGWTCCLFLLLNPFLNCPQVFPRISLTPALREKVWEWRQGQPFPSQKICGFTLQTSSSPSLEPYKQGGALHSARHQTHWTFP